MPCFRNIDIPLTRLLRRTGKEPLILGGALPTGSWNRPLAVSSGTHARVSAGRAHSPSTRRHTPRIWNGPASNNRLLPGTPLRPVGGSEFAAKNRGPGGDKDAKGPPCIPPVPPALPPASPPLRFSPPWASLAEPQLPAEIARLRCEHQPVSPSPRVAQWSRRVEPLVPKHSLPFTTFRLYKDWLIPLFFFFLLLPLQWKALHAQPNKVLRRPHPHPQSPCQKREGRLETWNSFS